LRRSLYIRFYNSDTSGFSARIRGISGVCLIIHTPTNDVSGCGFGKFFYGGRQRQREREMKFEFLDKRVFLGHTNGGEVIWIMEEYSAEQSW
jgi:hypothetical protein